jgi:DNA-directed RNA polymerase subunit E"
MSEKACRECNTLTKEPVCPNCKSTNLSDDHSGVIIIIDPEHSTIAKLMKVTKKGRYALKVR